MGNKGKGLVFMGMGFELVAMIIGALYLGELLDKQYGWGGLGVAGLSLLVLAGWLYHLVVLLRRFMHSEEEKDPGN